MHDGEYGGDTRRRICPLGSSNVWRALCRRRTFGATTFSSAPNRVIARQASRGDDMLGNT